MRVRLSLILAVVLALGGLFYGLVRSSQNRALAAEVESYRSTRSKVERLLSGLDPGLLTPLPAPEPDLKSWMMRTGLQGLSSRLVDQKPTRNGGVSVTLRGLNPGEVSELMSRLSQVSLRLTRFQLTDADGDGSWEVILMVEAAP